MNFALQRHLMTGYTYSHQNHIQRITHTNRERAQNNNTDITIALFYVNVRHQIGEYMRLLLLLLLLRCGDSITRCWKQQCTATPKRNIPITKCDTKYIQTNWQYI